MNNFVNTLLVCSLLLMSTMLSAQTTNTSDTPEAQNSDRTLYYSILVGFMPGYGGDDSETSGLRGLNIINFMIGHRFNDYAHLGGGVAWDVYDMGLISFRLDFNGSILNENEISPYYRLQTGYGFAIDLNNEWNDRVELKGGLLVHPAIGIKFRTKKSGDILLEAGYIFQKASRDDPDFMQFEDIVYRRLNIRFGVQF